MTPLPERTKQEGVPKERRFDVDAVFDDEQARLKEWLVQRANDDLGSRMKVQPAARAETVAEEVIARFGPSDTDVNPALMGDVKGGTLQTFVPSAGTILGFQLAWIGCTVLELAVIGVQILVSDDIGALALVPGGVLAFGAVLGGIGLGELWIGALSRGFHAAWKIMPPTKSRAIAILELVIGVTLLIAIGVLRTTGLEKDERTFLITVTLALGALVIVFKALHGLNDAKYTALWNRMYDVQVWHANARHRESRNLYKQYYLDLVTHFDQGGGTRVPAMSEAS